MLVRYVGMPLQVPDRMACFCYVVEETQLARYVASVELYCWLLPYYLHRIDTPESCVNFVICFFFFQIYPYGHA